MRKHLTLIAALAAALLPAAAAQAQAPEGIAEFDTTGTGVAIDGPATLATVPSLVPDREDFAFLGEAGDLVWIAGADAEGNFPTLDASAADTDLTLALDKTEGPGDAWLYTFTGPGLAEPLASTEDDESFAIPAGTTAAVVLAVDEPGRYTIELAARENVGHASVATTRGQAASSTTATYTLTAAPATVEEAQAIADPADRNGSAQADTSCTTIAEGHIDIGPRFADGTWTAQLRDDTASESVWRDLEDVVLTVPDASLFPIPEGYDFLGAPGDEIYLLPQVQAAGIVWPGWNTQDKSVIDAVPGSVDWNLTAVDGPGEFTLFLSNTFGGAEVLFDSSAALPQTVSVPRNTHAHGNWTFSEPGVYLLTVEFTATTGDGETVTDTKNVQLAVGDATDPGDACHGEGGSAGKDTDNGGDDGGFLPTTGTGWLLWGLGAAAIAVVVGATIMFATRKRRNASGDADGN
ncbi:TIGR03773 family transporter-associated surface protein [Glycomyces sp. NPDC046736]|uniref:TIGR03773 family transporter-associated surface protein n=1 Tax=Glycomyces sp. NPDC046736 TaxID=3155615 RepID=UPI0033C3CA74